MSNVHGYYVLSKLQSASTELSLMLVVFFMGVYRE